MLSLFLNVFKGILFKKLTFSEQTVAVGSTDTNRQHGAGGQCKAGIGVRFNFFGVKLIIYPVEDIAVINGLIRIIGVNKAHSGGWSRGGYNIVFLEVRASNLQRL